MLTVDDNDNVQPISLLKDEFRWIISNDYRFSLLVSQNNSDKETEKWILS